MSIRTKSLFNEPDCVRSHAGVGCSGFNCCKSDDSCERGGLAVLVFLPGAMIRMGGNVWEGMMPTLRAESHGGDNTPHILIAFEASRRDGIRMQNNGTVNTLTGMMGTGGNNVPMIATEQETTHDVVGSLQSRSYKGPNHEAARDGQLVIEHMAATDIEGKEIAATLRGFGHGWQGQHNSTHSVATSDEAIPIQGTMIGRQDHNGPGGVGAREPGAPMYTLETISTHAIEHQTVVRRLTPIECERLMGWPDDHTLRRVDGRTNADSTRYKMCGNGVASPVAEWIGRQILAWEGSETAL